MSNLICGKAAVGGNYNSTRDTPACHIALSLIQKRNELDVELYISEGKELFYSLYQNKDALESDAGLTFD